MMSLGFDFQTAAPATAVSSPPPVQRRGGVGGSIGKNRRFDERGTTPHPQPSPPRAMRVGGRGAKDLVLGCNRNHTQNKQSARAHPCSPLGREMFDHGVGRQ